MQLDFMLEKYRNLCRVTRNFRYNVLTVKTYLNRQNPPDRFLILRHDVDRKPNRAVKMAKLEQEFGINSTYYFRFNRKVFQPDLIKEIASMGHEIGYHYETLDKTKGDYEKAIQIFEHELAEFRKITEVNTICMHGNPLTKWVNRDLWTKYDFRDFGLVGEAYLSFSSDNIVYLSDTGRTWDTEHKIKDYLHSATSVDNKECKSPVATSTNDIMKLFNNGQLNYAYLLVHPERWSNNLIGWAADSVLDTGVNLAKGMLILRKRA